MIVDNVVSSGPALKLPAHLSLGQHVIDILKANSENDSVALINGDSGEETKYSEVLRSTVDAALGLQRLGVKRGDAVALCSENRVEYLSAALGIICCGATVVPYNLMYTKDEIVNALNISQPKLIFASRAALKRHQEAIKSCASIQTIVQLDGSEPVASGVLLYVAMKGSVCADDVRFYEPVTVQGLDDVALLLFSSGTTGLPKGVMLSHFNVLYSVALFEHDAESSKKILSIVPWYHAYGLMSLINYLIVNNTVVFFSSGFNPQKYLATIQKYKIQMLAAVPPIVVFLAKSPIVEKYDLSSVNVVWCGAAPLTSETIEAAMKRMPNCQGIFQAYGMTETSLAATKDRNNENSPRKAGSAGYPIPGAKIKVVDIETRVKLGPHQNGEICVKGPLIMKGYLGNETATRDTIDEEGYLKTGDIGYYDADGCFFIVDRLKELIKYKGYQVAPASVENILLQHSGVAECGVVGTPDEEAGELPTAFVVAKPGVALTEADLLEFTASRLSSSSRLRGGVFIVKEIPKNPSGKILRRMLKQKILEMKKSKL